MKNEKILVVLVESGRPGRVVLGDSFKSLADARYFAKKYCLAKISQPFKVEFCKFCERDGNFSGFCITIF